MTYEREFQVGTVWKLKPGMPTAFHYPLFKDDYFTVTRTIWRDGTHCGYWEIEMIPTVNLKRDGTAPLWLLGEVTCGDHFEPYRCPKELQETKDRILHFQNYKERDLAL